MTAGQAARRLVYFFDFSGFRSPKCAMTAEAEVVPRQNCIRRLKSFV
jgi:hypothetical protein